MPKTQTHPDQFTLCLGDDGSSKPIGHIEAGRLIVRQDMTEAEWVEALRGFKAMKSKSEIWLSDLVQWGVAKFGKNEAHAYLSQLEFDMPDVKAVLDIASVPESVRRPELEAGHYVALARSGLSAKEQKRWAGVAAEQNLTPSVLKVSMAAGEVVDQRVAKQQTTGIITIDGIAAEYEIWFKRVKGYPGIGKMKPEDWRHLKELIAPIVELDQALDEFLGQ